MNTYKSLIKIAMFALTVLFESDWCFSQLYVNNQATTVGQSYAMGMSDVIRSKGEANLNNSQAAINLTQAQSAEIKNREQWTSTYFQMRRDQRAAVAEERGPNPTAEDFVRFAQMGKPKPLSPEQLDTVTGKIYWPRSLRTDQFAADRSQMDEIFAKRARYGDISMDDFMKVRDVTNNMIEMLKQQIRDIPPMEYTSAKQFLVSLAFQVQLLAG